MTQQNASYLFLCYRLASGYGVDEVVLQHARLLQKRGANCTIACVEKLMTPPEILCLELLPALNSLEALIGAQEFTHIVAHTEPWMSLLAQVSTKLPVKKIVWEHGDPSPELIPHQALARQLEKTNKLKNVYPFVDQVVAISEFIKSDIEWQKAVVIPNGLSLRDIVPKQYPETISTLKIGTLMRLGAGESLYKGQDLFLKLAIALKESKLPAELHIAGKGSSSEAKDYTKHGIQTHLNLGHEEKINYLNGLDVFFSPSLWEGFNLPLIEAQTLGTPSFAFDTGAHPEVCPHIVSNINELIGCMKAAYKNPALLKEWGETGHQMVTSRFNFEEGAKFLSSAPSGKQLEYSPRARSLVPRGLRLKLFFMGLRTNVSALGWRGFLVWFSKKTLRKILR